MYTNYYLSSKLFHGSIPQIMGTNFDILITEIDKSISIKIFNLISNLILKIEKLLNCFDPTSEISILNNTSSKISIPLSNDLWTILNNCIYYNERTQGLFDISLGNHSSFKLSSLDQSFYSEDSNITLDFGGYAKGYALKQIKNVLLRYQVFNAFINFGNSSILALGKHPLSFAWPISISNPYNPIHILDSFELNNLSLSISGNMPTHQHHIFNPHTKQYTSESRITSVTAIDPLDAEILSTVAMISDSSTFNEIIKKFNIINHTNYDCSK